MSGSMQIDEARRSLQRDLRANARKKREIAKAKAPVAGKGAAEASLNEIRDAIAKLHALVKNNPTGPVKFTIVERDLSGHIKSFTVDQQ